jgi:hypothetical protein
MNIEYQQGDRGYRMAFVKQLRRQLSELLPSERYPGISWYQSLSHGELPVLSENVPEYTLENMIFELDSSSWVNHLYNEFISDILDIDIYFIDINNSNVYLTGDEYELLYKNRNSILIGYTEGHYETIGLCDGDTFTVSFLPNDILIEKIREKILSSSKA